MRIPLKSCRIKVNVERSVFIATLSRIDTLEDFRDFLDGIRREFPDATHNCWAYRIFKNGEILEHFSDAGEPSGTAGVPILNSMKKHDLVNGAIVVTRYFGGVKLGRKGLRDAYSRAAQEVISSCALGEAKVVGVYRIVTDVKNYGKVVSRLSRVGKIISEDFREGSFVIVYTAKEALNGSEKIGEKLGVET